MRPEISVAVAGHYSRVTTPSRDGAPAAQLKLAGEGGETELVLRYGFAINSRHRKTFVPRHSRATCGFPEKKERVRQIVLALPFGEKQFQRDCSREVATSVNYKSRQRAICISSFHAGYLASSHVTISYLSVYNNHSDVVHLQI